MDVHTPAQRSHNMSRVRGRDTKPEMLLRRGLHATGLRYRLHVRDLPGCPDVVFPFDVQWFWYMDVSGTGTVPAVPCVDSP